MIARTLLSAWVCLLVAATAATAQTYPTRQITLVVPYAVGGPTDNIGRVFADAMRRQLRAAIVVENRPGASGSVGFKAVAAAKPDGHTLLVAPAGQLAITPAAGVSTFDVDAALAMVAIIAESPQIIVASPTVKADTLGEFIAFAKANPGKLNYGSPGVGTVPHLGAEMLKHQAGLDMLHVPYRGTGPALPDLLSGRLQMLFGDISSVLPLVEAGRLKAYAISSPQRSALAPSIPTTAEAGMPNVITRNWNALMGPAGLPQPVVARLAEAMRAALGDEEYLAAMRRQGSVPIESTPEHAARYVIEERRRLTPLVKAIDLKPD